MVNFDLIGMIIITFLIILFINWYMNKEFIKEKPKSSKIIHLYLGLIFFLLVFIHQYVWGVMGIRFLPYGSGWDSCFLVDAPLFLFTIFFLYKFSRGEN